MTSINSAPVAYDDDAVTSYNTPIIIDVLANDVDPDNDTISLTGLFTNLNGGLFEVTQGKVKYTPDNQYT